MTRAVSNIRWRLCISLASLAAAVVLTIPPLAARQVERHIGEIWPNRLGVVADIIWPNDPVIVNDTIWPNLPGIVDSLGPASV